MSPAERGFSLVEMMAAIALMSLAMSLTGAFFVASRHALSDELAREETLQGLRATLDTMERDLRLAGACLPTSGNDFPPLSGTNSGTLDGVTVSAGLVFSNMTCIASTVCTCVSNGQCQASPPCSTTGTAAGATTLPLLSANGFAAGQIGYVRAPTNSGEFFNVASVNTSSNTLTLAAGLKAAYANGSGVNAVDQRVYAIDPNTYAPVTVLTIAANGASPIVFAYGVQAVNVQYILVDGTTVNLPSSFAQWSLVNQLSVQVTMQSAKPLSNGQYYTVTGSIIAKPRNLLPGSTVLGTTPS
jgi:prepilin-type N-terminal cleavage/methylation domain-containing protein